MFYKTSINDEFNKTFRKSFLLMKNQVNRQKLMFGEVSYFLRGSNFRILVIFFNTYYFHTFTFNKHENRTWTQIGLFWWEGRVGGRNNLGIFKSQGNFFHFYPLSKTPPPFSGKTTNFRVFSYISLVNKIIVIFHPIFRNFQEIFFNCIK